MGSITRPQATLEDRWDYTGDTVLLSGIQALVRLPLLRRQLDTAQGWRTAGFISGYRGSPLGGYDRELTRQADRLAAADIVFRPGLNEDLAATAIWGTQQLGFYPDARVEGVFGIWYGKGPGLDRSGDVMRHANSAGTDPRGGVLALAGDDPVSKSSTITSGCEHTFLDLEMPVLDPANVAEVLEFGMKGIALSRFAGVWVGLKCTAETMDGSATFRLDPADYATVMPNGVTIPPGGLGFRTPDTPIAQEERLRRFKLPAAVAFARVNGLDRLVIDPPRARFGLVARGKAYVTLRQALGEAGLDDATLRTAGVRLWKIGLAWPLDAEAAREFGRGLEAVLVVEDRRALLEPQLREALYDAPDRPRILGKRDAAGAPLLSELTELDVAGVLRALAATLPAPLRTEALAARLAALEAQAAPIAPLHDRTPYFCPGCPHSTSTRLPEGSIGHAGIGCHYLARYMDRATELATHMGGEGTLWAGQAPFVATEHVFANMGDGTYAHSGSLAVRAAIAAGNNLTFKILVNSAVAMTGGQTIEGELGVPEIAAQVVAEGAARVVIVGDDPDRHRGDLRIPPTVSFHPRAELDAVQRELRATPGVTVLIFDQQCATERRRKRKRGQQAAAERRVVINPRICEDCGDCSRASNCIAVEPIETPFGRKRGIDQTACNQDLSCVQGFCPSFVTLAGAEPVRPNPAAVAGTLPEPTPASPLRGEPAVNILIAGVGGQGVTGLAAILAQAAHMEGRPVRTVDQLGLAQKGGGVFAQLRIGLPGASGEAIDAPGIGLGAADLLLSADLVVAHGRTARPLLSAARTAAVLNAEVQPTAEFVLNTETRYDRAAMLASVEAGCREVIALPGLREVGREFGDLIYLNVWLLGVAFQRGLVPLSAEAIGRALELNGAQVARNKAAFTLGRVAALAPPPLDLEAETLGAMIARRVADLTGYQGPRLAADYAGFMAQVGATAPEPLTRAVAHQLHRLLAYKDEYEVARLHSLPDWQSRLADGFTGTTRMELHLAPPLLSRVDPATGRPAKRRFGPWMFTAMRLLRHGRILRGTPLDPFGYTEERRVERALPAEFRAALMALLPRLTPATLPAITAWVEAWGMIKGFGPIKARNLAAFRARLPALVAAIDAAATAPVRPTPGVSAHAA